MYINKKTRIPLATNGNHATIPPVFIFANVFLVILLLSFYSSLALSWVEFSLQCLEFFCITYCDYYDYCLHTTHTIEVILLICTGRLGQYTHSKEKKWWREKEKRRRTFDITDKQDFPKAGGSAQSVREDVDLFRRLMCPISEEMLCTDLTFMIWWWLLWLLPETCLKVAKVVVIRNRLH